MAEGEDISGAEIVNEAGVPAPAVIADALDPSAASAAAEETSAAPEIPPVQSEASAPAASAVSDAAAPATDALATPGPATPATPASLTPSTRSSPHFGHYSVKEAQEMSIKKRDAMFHEKADKILAYVAKHGKISRDEAARLLIVSNNSAYLYLKRLIREGKLRRVGAGKAVRYEQLV